MPSLRLARPLVAPLLALLFTLSANAGVLEDLQVLSTNAGVGLDEEAIELSVLVRNSGSSGGGTEATLRLHRAPSTDVTTADPVAAEQVFTVPDAGALDRIFVSVPAGMPDRIEWFLVCVVVGPGEDCTAKVSGLSTPALPITPTDRRAPLIGRFGAGEASSQGDFRGVAVIAGYAYIKLRGADPDGGNLLVFDIRDLQESGLSEAFQDREPVAMVATDVGGGGGVFRHAGRLYVFGTAGIQLVDLSEPEAPVPQPRLLETSITTIALDGDRLATTGFGGSAVYRVVPDGTLTQLATIGESGSAIGLSGDLVIIGRRGGGEQNGLSVYQLDGSKGVGAVFQSYLPTGFFAYHIDPFVGILSGVSVAIDGAELTFNPFIAARAIELGRPADVKATDGYSGRARVVGPPDGTLYSRHVATRGHLRGTVFHGHGGDARPRDGFPHFSDADERYVYLLGSDQVTVLAPPLTPPAHLHIPRAEPVANLDGNITEAEWLPALDVEIESGEGNVLYYLSHDGNRLQLAVDDATDLGLDAGDGLAVRFDDEGGTLPGVLADEAWTSPLCVDADEGEIAFGPLDPDPPARFEAFAVGATRCGVTDAAAFAAAALSDATGNIRTEARISVVDGPLQARPGEVFGAYVSPITSDGYSDAALPGPKGEFDPMFFSAMSLDRIERSQIVRPVTATVLTGSEAQPVSQLVDRSGLRNGAFGRHLPGDEVAWVTNDAGLPYYFANPAPVIEIDLGADTLLTGMLLWPFATGFEADGERNGAAARGIELEFLRDGAIRGLPSGPVQQFVADAPPPGPGPFPLRQFMPLDQPVIARFVRIRIRDNWGATGEPGGSRVGLGEVAFVTPIDALFSDGFESEP